MTAGVFRSTVRLGGAFPMLMVVMAGAGCNAVLGIHEPEDKPLPIVVVKPPKDAGRPPSSDGATPPPVGTADHRWADWPMPNPPSTDLPNPQSYDTGRTPGVVFDRVTRLEWQRTFSETRLTWAEAKDYCHALPLVDAGWRLPSRIELLSIVDFTQAEPLIDPTAFPGTPPEPFWTVSPTIDDESSAWSVQFGFGTVSAASNMITTPLRVRCVR